MKTILILAAVMACFFLAAPNEANAQNRKPARTITGTIKGFECGDNCYLTIKDSRGKERTGLCTAAACQSWNENTVMPKRFKGKRVRITVGKGKQLDGAGTVMGTMDAFKRIVFL